MATGLWHCRDRRPVDEHPLLASLPMLSASVRALGRQMGVQPYAS